MFPVGFSTMSNGKTLWMPLLHIHMERASVWLMVCLRWRQVYIIIMVRRKSNWIAHAVVVRCYSVAAARRRKLYTFSAAIISYFPSRRRSRSLNEIRWKRVRDLFGSKVCSRGVYPLPWTQYIYTVHSFTLCTCGAFIHA